jgi:hypothetical protein
MQRRHWFQLATGSVVAITVGGCGNKGSSELSSEAQAASSWLATLPNGQISGDADTRDLLCGVPIEQRQAVVDFLSKQEDAPFAKLMASGSSLEARDADERPQFTFELKFVA